MEKLTPDSTQTKAIRQRMEDVRLDLDESVQEIVEDSRDIGEWRSYVRAYPRICLGAAFAVGYLIIPRRHYRTPVDAKTLGEMAKQSHLLATSSLSMKNHVRSLLSAIVGNLVRQGVSSFIERQARKLLANQNARSHRVS